MFLLAEKFKLQCTRVRDIEYQQPRRRIDGKSPRADERIYRWIQTARQFIY